MDTVPPKIGSRYQDGLVVAQMDSRTTWGNTDEDYLTKRLVVATRKNAVGSYELVGFVEVELCDNEEGEGYIDLPNIEVYKTPFPYNLAERKKIIRSWAKEPQFYLH